MVKNFTVSETLLTASFITRLNFWFWAAQCTYIYTAFGY